MKRERGISYCQQQQGGKQHATINYNLKWQLARRWHGQHGGRGSTGAEAVEVVAAGARRHGGGGGDVRVGGPLFFVSFSFCHVLSGAILFFITSTWEFVVYVLIYVRMWSVFGPSMSGNGDTKVSRHTKNHVAKIGLSGRKWATFRLVGDMSPTFPAKPIGSGVAMLGFSCPIMGHQTS